MTLDDVVLALADQATVLGDVRLLLIYVCALLTALLLVTLWRPFRGGE